MGFPLTRSNPKEILPAGPRWLHTAFLHYGVTAHPTDTWTSQQLREATPWGKAPRFLIHDRDRKFAALFSALAAASNIKQLVTPFQAPKANAICERFIGSLKRECLDHMFILHQGHLRKVVAEYMGYYNRSRPHQGIQQRIPARLENSFSHSGRSAGKVITRPVLGGLHHTYARIGYVN
ncbi:MAG: transposase [Chloroflexi bacterium]|nr:transposase [Chloroflexota bacterium]